MGIILPLSMRDRSNFPFLYSHLWNSIQLFQHHSVFWSVSTHPPTAAATVTERANFTVSWAVPCSQPISESSAPLLACTTLSELDFILICARTKSPFHMLFRGFLRLIFSLCSFKSILSQTYLLPWVGGGPQILQQRTIPDFKLQSGLFNVTELIHLFLSPDWVILVNYLGRFSSFWAKVVHGTTLLTFVSWLHLPHFLLSFMVSTVSPTSTSPNPRDYFDLCAEVCSCRVLALLLLVIWLCQIQVCCTF